MKKYFLFLLISISTVFGSSLSYTLGASNNKKETSIVISYSEGFVSLVNDGLADYSAPIYEGSSYKITEGWNTLFAPKDGVDVVETFKNRENIELLFVYDKLTNVWAGYSNDKSIKKELSSKRILSLKYIESGVKFFTFSRKNVDVEIKSLNVNKTCLKLMKTPSNSSLLDSGLSKEEKFSKEDAISINSKYLAHYKRGIYNDTRVILIYPKIEKFSQKEELLTYGPASPRVTLKYAKEYEDKVFYIYDYLNHSCYKGLFPSRKTPPFSSLVKLY